MSLTSKSERNEPLCVGSKEGARLMDMSEDSFQRLRLPSFKIGRLTRYRISTIKNYIDQQEEKSK